MYTLVVYKKEKEIEYKIVESVIAKFVKNLLKLLNYKILVINKIENKEIGEKIGKIWMRHFSN